MTSNPESPYWRTHEKKTVVLHKDLLAWLKAHAKQRSGVGPHTSVNAVIVEALEQYKQEMEGER